METSFKIPGDVVPKERPMVTRSGIAFTRKRTKKYEELVRMCWQQESGVRIPDDTPIKMVVHAHFTIPKSFSKVKKSRMKGKPVTKRPDADNGIKSIADALNGYAYKDDSAIYNVQFVKRYDDIGYTEVFLIWEGETNGEVGNNSE